MTNRELRFDSAATSGTVLAVSLAHLLRSRALVQANSGAGKSHLLRAMLEQTEGQVQQIVVDPEGEFFTLREIASYVLVGRDGDFPAHPKTAKTLARKLLEVGASAILDLSELSNDDKREYVKLFLTELVGAPRNLWRPLLVVIDEAHLFCPERGSGEAQSAAAVMALCTLGRKRGYCAVLATQRISKLHKDAAAELLNKFVGRTGLDVDMRRAGDELGLDKDGRMQLRDLQPGEWHVFGPAIDPGVHRVRGSKVRSTHPDITNGLKLVAPPANATVQAMVAEIGDLPKIAEQEAKTLETLEKQVRMLQSQLRQAQSNKPQASAEDIEQAVAQERHEAQLRAQQRDRAVQTAVDAVVVDLRAAIDRLEAVRRDTPIADLVVEKVQQRVRTMLDAPTRAIGRHERVDQVERTGTKTIGKTPQRILNALRFLESTGISPATRASIAGLVGVSADTGTFRNYLSELRSASLIVDAAGTTVALSPEGREVASDEGLPRSLEQLHTTWVSKVGGTAGRMLRVLLEVHPHPMTREVLARECNVDHTTGTFRNYLSELRSPGLIIDVSKSVVRASDMLFPEGLE